MLTSSFKSSLQKRLEVGSSHMFRCRYSGACGWSPSSKIALLQQHLGRVKTSPAACNDHQGSTILPDLLSLLHTSYHIRERMNLIISRTIYISLKISVPEARRWNCLTTEQADSRTLASSLLAIQTAHARVVYTKRHRNHVIGSIGSVYICHKRVKDILAIVIFEEKKKKERKPLDSCRLFGQVCGRCQWRLVSVFCFEYALFRVAPPFSPRPAY